MGKHIDRRKFLALVSGAGAALAASCASTREAGAVRPSPAAQAGDLLREGAGPAAVVPRRPFGGTGVTVSKLCLGGSSVAGPDAQSLLDDALRLGVDSWEHTQFTGGVFGDYFRTHPGVRERVFLSGKTRSTSPAVMQADLERALAQNATSAVDFFAVHGVEDAEVLTADVRRWAERAKGEGKIRFFGFCTHKRMDRCLDRAATLGWIDGIQVFYNYRMQVAGSMEAALRRCHEVGIGIVTVKSMGLTVGREADLPPRDALVARLAPHGVSPEQAKLRAIWQNPHVTSVCSLMPGAAILQANARAAMDERPVHGEVARALAEHARDTGRYFCRRCGACDATGPEGIPVFNVMESLMYARGYGSKDLAKKILAGIPKELRERMLTADCSRAEAGCPQRMPIARLVREAYLELNG